MRLVALALALLLSGCAVPPAAPAPTSTAAAATTPIAVASPTAPSAAPTPVKGLEVPDPVVRIDRAPFAISTTLTLRPGTIDQQAIDRARVGVEEYLRRLDWYRNGASLGELPITGRFAEAVKDGLDATKGHGERTFVLEAMRLDRYVVKPWGTPAIAEASVTIVDMPKQGTGGASRESGKLLLDGDRFFVVDGWDSKSGTWFNSEQQAPLSDSKVRELTDMAIRNYLRQETWVVGSSRAGVAEGGDAFTQAHSAYLRLLDSSKASRLFSEVIASVERVETFSDLDEGLATVRLSGAAMTVDISGRSETTPFERTVIVAMTGAIFQVVDERLASGEWMSGGGLMAVLLDRDRTLT